MDILKRSALAIGLFVVGVLLIGYFMIEQGSAYAGNFAWDFIGPLFLLFWGVLKIAFYALIAAAGLGIVYALSVIASTIYGFFDDLAQKKDKGEKLEAQRLEREEQIRKAHNAAQEESHLAMIRQAERLRREEELAKSNPKPDVKKESPKIEPPKSPAISTDEAKRRAIKNIIGR